MPQVIYITYTMAAWDFADIHPQPSGLRPSNFGCIYISKIPRNHGITITYMDVYLCVVAIWLGLSNTELDWIRSCQKKETSRGSTTTQSRYNWGELYLYVKHAFYYTSEQYSRTTVRTTSLVTTTYIFMSENFYVTDRPKTVGPILESFHCIFLYCIVSVVLMLIYRMCQHLK